MASVSQVKRLFDLLSKLQSEQSYTAAELAEQMGVSRRTMFRDLKDLEKLGVQARYNDRLQRYVLSLSEETAAAAQITPTELQSLLSLGQGGVANREQLAPEVLARRIGVVSGGLKQSGRPSVQSPLAEAILKSAQVAIELHGSAMRIVEPHRLLVDGGVCYLVAKAPGSEWQGRISLDDISDVEMTSEYFSPLDDATLEELTTAIWAAEASGERAVVTFSPEVAEALIDEQRLPGTRLTRFENGRVRVDKPMTALRPMLSWVLSFGSSAVVESPQSLRNAVMSEWRRVSENYHGRHEQTPAAS